MIDKVINASAIAGIAICLCLFFAKSQAPLAYTTFFEVAYAIAGPLTAVACALWLTRISTKYFRSGTKKLHWLQVGGIFIFFLLGCLAAAFVFAVGIAFS